MSSSDPQLPLQIEDAGRYTDYFKVVPDLWGCAGFTGLCQIYWVVQDLRGCARFMGMCQIYGVVPDLRGCARYTGLCRIYDVRSWQMLFYAGHNGKFSIIWPDFQHFGQFPALLFQFYPLQPYILYELFSRL